MYADVITKSMKKAIDETERRRKIQMEYNKEHHIVPKTIIKQVKNTLEIAKKVDTDVEKIDLKEIPKKIELIKGLMRTASKELDFEKAIKYREEIKELKKLIGEK